MTTLAILGEIVTTAGGSLTDEDCLIRGRYLEEVATRLTVVAGSPGAAMAILAALGWQEPG